MAKRLIQKAERVCTTVYGVEEFRIVRVYRDTEWDEYVVTLEQAGVRLLTASYHTQDRVDAIGTAKLILERD